MNWLRCQQNNGEHGRENGREHGREHGGEHGKLSLSDDSSDGRAIDCRSIGRVFDSLSSDFINRFCNLIKLMDNVNLQA